jgi:POT family proton-dependent oligopeptide transporter
LSAVTKLAPARLGAQTMGLWFLAGSLGNLIAGSFADVMSASNVGSMPSVFLGMAAVIGGVALVLALLTPALKHLAHGIE